MIVCVGSPYHYIAFKFSVGFFSWLQKILVYNFTYVSIYSNFWTISERLGWAESGVSVLCFHAFFFPLRVNSKITVQRTKNTVHALFIYCSRTVHGSHDTIHTFKNYFATVFSVFSFSNNKFNPNGP